MERHSRAMRATASLVCVAFLVTSCGGRAATAPFIQVPPPDDAVRELADLDRYAPLYGIVKLRDGREFEGMILSAGESVEFKSAFRAEPRRMMFAADDVIRIKCCRSGGVLEHTFWAGLFGLFGALTGWMIKGGSNLENAIFDKDDDVDGAGIRRWGARGFLWGAVLSPLLSSPYRGQYVTVYDVSRAGHDVRSRLPRVDWSDWE